MGIKANITTNKIEVAAQGRQGVQGIEGPQGIQGIQGIQGEIGPAGGLGDVLEVTAAYSTTNTNTVIYFKGDFNVNLHSLASATRVLALKVALQGADNVTLIPDGSDLIEGASSYVMNSDEGLFLIPTSDGWEIL